MTAEEIAGLVEAAGVAFSVELANLGDELAGWQPEEGEWSAKEVLGHIYRSDQKGFGGRIREILAAPTGEEPPLKATGPIPSGYREKPLDDLLQLFLRQRQAEVEQIRKLRPADLDRAGIHERVGRLTVSDILHEWVHHDRAHLEQVYSNVRRRVWPEMGNAQKFSS